MRNEFLALTCEIQYTKRYSTGPDLHTDSSIDFYVDTLASIEKFNFLLL